MACGSDHLTGLPALSFFPCNSTPVVAPTADWPTNCPAAVGLDSAKLRLAWRTLAGYGGPLSLLVVRRGQLVMESYFVGGTGRTALFQVRSVTKSVESALVGVELLRGTLDTSSRTIADVIPQYIDTIADPRVAGTTLEQLMSMQGGWATDQVDANTFLATFLDRPLVFAPGTNFFYDDGAYHVVSAMVRALADTAPLAVANQSLFGPMGFTVPGAQWGADDQGINVGYSGLRLTAREMAKFGYLYLHEGVWDGTRLVDSAWVYRSTHQQTQAGVDFGSMGYGYGWWMTPYTNHPAYSALGAGGQTITVIPDLDMVVVITGDPLYSTVNPTAYRQVIPNYIVPAAQ